MGTGDDPLGPSWEPPPARQAAREERSGPASINGGGREKFPGSGDGPPEMLLLRDRRPRQAAREERAGPARVNGDGLEKVTVLRSPLAFQARPLSPSRSTQQHGQGAARGENASRTGSPGRHRCPTIPRLKLREERMADSVYKVIELIGTSSESWEKAALTAVERAAESLRDLRIAEVTAQDVQLKDGKVELFRTKLKVSFKYEKGSD